MNKNEGYFIRVRSSDRVGGISDRYGGFTFLELVVVILVISVLGAFALDRYHKLLVDVERTSMEHDLGVMRSAISMQVADHFVAGDLPGLRQLVGSNPMELLAEKPNNYLGVMTLETMNELPGGSWFYDDRQQALVYLVRNQNYFATTLDDPARVHFRIVPVFSDRAQGGGGEQYISGLRLKALDAYRWLRPWD